MLEMRKLHSRGSRLAQVCQLISIAWFMVCFLSWFPIFKTHSHPFSSQTYTEPLLYPWVYPGPIQSTSVYWAPIVSLGLLWSYSVYKCLLSPYCIGEGNGNQLQYSCLENPMDGGAGQATVHGVTRVRHDWATKPPPYVVEFSVLPHQGLKYEWGSQTTRFKLLPHHSTTVWPWGSNSLSVPLL